MQTELIQNLSIFSTFYICTYIDGKIIPLAPPLKYSPVFALDRMNEGSEGKNTH